MIFAFEDVTYFGKCVAEGGSLSNGVLVVVMLLRKRQSGGVEVGRGDG